jgi:hypothetical protein
MAVDKEFPQLRRRVRQLDGDINAIERTLEANAGQLGDNAVYLLESMTKEQAEIDFLLRFYQRQTNGALSRMQGMLVAGALAFSVALLVLLLLQRLP